MGVERGPGDDPRAPAHPAQPGIPRPARQLRQPHPHDARSEYQSAGSRNLSAESRNLSAEEPIRGREENENGALNPSRAKRDIDACYF